MSNNFEDEFKKRIEDSEWDKKIGEMVLREHSSRSNISKTYKVSFLVLFLVGVTYLGGALETELAVEETGFELLSQISGSDLSIFDEE